MSPSWTSSKTPFLNHILIKMAQSMGTRDLEILLSPIKEKGKRFRILEAQPGGPKSKIYNGHTGTATTIAGSIGGI